MVYDKSLLNLQKCLSLFLNDTATSDIYTLSLHDALPISIAASTFLISTIRECSCRPSLRLTMPSGTCAARFSTPRRSEEHTSELQSQSNLVCRLLLEKKK